MKIFYQTRKIFSALILFFFLAGNLLSSTPGLAQELSFLNGALKPLEIPAELGQVTRLILPQKQKGVIVHIQSSHRHYENELHVQSLLEDLQKNYGTELVFLEGGWSKLSPELFRLFPEKPELQEKIIDHLIQAGELTGAEAFLIQNAKGSGWGVEDADLYLENGATFKTVLDLRPTAEKFLSYLQLSWERLANVHASKELMAFFRQQRAFEEQRMTYAEWFSYLKNQTRGILKVDLGNIKNQDAWPVLTRFIRLLALDVSRPDARELQREMDHFLEILKQRKSPASIQETILKLFQQNEGTPFIFHENRIEGMSGLEPSTGIRPLFEKIYDYLPADFSFDAYPQLKMFIQRKVLIDEMTQKGLTQETEELQEQLAAHLAVSREEKQLLRLRRQAQQLRKLFELTLTREEFQKEFESNSEINHPQTLAQSILDLSDKNKTALPQDAAPDADVLYAQAIRFYTTAIRREEAMTANTVAQMKKSGKKKAVMVTGGFHSEGLEAAIAKEGFGYIQIMPRITEIPADLRQKYLKTAIGIEPARSSWEAMLATNLVADPRANSFFDRVAPLRARRILDEVKRVISAQGSGRNALSQTFQNSGLASRLSALTLAETLSVRSESRQAPFAAGYGIEPPYDIELSQRIEDEEPNKEIRAERQVSEVFSKFDYGVEEKNRQRLRQAFSGKGRYITVSRFGRASYFLMLLASASRYLENIEELRNIAKELDELFELPIANSFSNQLLYLKGAVEDLARLGADQNVSHADVQGRHLQLSQAVEDFQSRVIKQIGKARRVLKQQIAEERRKKISRISERLNYLENHSVQLAQRVKGLLDELQMILSDDQGTDANFSIFLQRASPTGVRNIVRVNQGEDPFEADEEHIAEAIQEAGKNVYATPDNRWLEVADYWIEALPLFIHEVKKGTSEGIKSYVVVDREKLKDMISASAEHWRGFLGRLDDMIDRAVRKTAEPLEGFSAEELENKVVIEQEAFEAVLRQLAPYWVHNIQNVMDTENMDIARQIIVYNDRSLSREAEAEQTARGISEEEAARVVLERHIREGNESKYLDEIISLAALIHETNRRLTHDVARAMEEKDIPRHQALLQVLTENESLDNLVGYAVQDFITEGTPLLAAIKKAVRESNLFQAKVKQYSEKEMALAPRREVPTWIILTTQAAGMSNMFASYWLEEEMGLYALASDRVYEGKSLDQEAEELAREYVEDVMAIGKSVIHQFNLAWKLEELTAEVGEKRAIVTMLERYPDLRAEVSKIAVLWKRYPHHRENLRQDPPSVLALLEQQRQPLENEATAIVIEQNQELRDRAKREPEKVRELVNAEEAYRLEREKVMRVLARQKVIDADPEKEFLNWYAEQYLRLHLPGGLNMGLSTARKEVISRYFYYEDGTLERVSDWGRFWQQRKSQGVQAKPGHPLWNLLNDPFYAYEASGGNKKSNKGYGPSRVDLGAKERYTVQELPQWIGPVDRYSKEAMSRFYRLYNFNVRAFDDVRIAEILKPGENHSMEQALFHAHRMQSFNRAIGVGNYSWLAYEWNDRSELFMRAAGACSGGFCQPKDIYFLPLVVSIAQNETLRYAGIPVNKILGIKSLIRRVLIERNSGRFATEADWRHWVFQELYQNEGVREAFGLREEKLEGGSSSFFFDPERFVPPLARLATALNQIGMRDPQVDPHGFINSLAADYHGRGKGDDEGGMRFAAVELIHTIQQALDEAHRRSKGQTPRYAESIIAVPAEYKPVPDVRLAVGVRLFEFMAGTGEHLMEAFTPEARALANFILNGYDPKDETLTAILKRALDVPEIDAEIQQQLQELFAAGQRPADIRLFSPFNMTLTSLLDYVTGNKLKEYANQARVALREQGLSDEQINANILTHGPKLEKFTRLKSLTPAKLSALKENIREGLFALSLVVRMDNQGWRQGPGSDIWEAIRGADVNAILVHYPEITGDEDAGTENLDSQILGEEVSTAKEVNPAGIMIRDLGRVRDTMMDGRPNSALIILDAPTQGRKNALDIRGIQQWMALNTTGKPALVSTSEEVAKGRTPVYTSPGVPQGEVERYEKQMRFDRTKAHDLFIALSDAVTRGNYETAMTIYQELQKVAGERLSQARNEEELAKSAAEWWRGGGFLNFSERHRYLSSGFLKAASGLPLQQLDWGTFLILGGMYVFNGEPEAHIRQAKTIFESAIKKLNETNGQKPSAVKSFSTTQTAEIEALFVTPKYVAPIEELKQIAGERTSLKRREVSEESAAGKALENYRLMQQAKAKTARGQGFKKAAGDQEAGNFDTAYQKAKAVLGNGQNNLSYEDYGTFLGYTKKALLAAVNEVIPDVTDAERKAMVQHIDTLFGQGRELDIRNWELIAGLKEDIGDFGRLGARLNGDRERLLRLTKAMELFINILLLEMTLEYRHMSDEQAKQIGEKKVSDEVWKKIAQFFATSLYDHYFDYTPKIITPAESGPYMTDYHFIFGENYDPSLGRRLGPGKPFTRDEILGISADMYAWANAYLDHLILEKTTLRHFPENARNALIGGGQAQAIGVANETDKEVEKRWWTITQKRELAYQNHDGHVVAAVFDDCENCAEVLYADRIENGAFVLDSRPNIAIVAPAGRTHITTFFEENPTYNQENPDRQANWIVTREAAFQEADVLQPDGQVKKETVMTVRSGFVYVSREEYILMRRVQLKNTLDEPSAIAHAAREADELLKQNPKGILVAVRFKNPIVSSVSFPFHGAPYYLRGEDEKAGLPSSQPWILNYLFYNKVWHSLIHDQDSGVIIPPEMQWLKAFQQDESGWPRSDEDIANEILNGREGFPGLSAFARQNWKIIAKAAAQSGGRGSLADQITDASGQAKPEKMEEFVDHLSQVGQVDDIVVQKLIVSDPRAWASQKYLQRLTDGLIQKGIAVPEWAKFFVYSRMIAVSQGLTAATEDEYDYVLELVVSSLQAISNVGSGGVLMKSRPEFYRSEKLAELLHERRKRAAHNSMRAVAKRAVQAAQEIEPNAGRTLSGVDRTGTPYTYPRYLMHDFLDVPVITINGREVQFPEIVDFKMDSEGNVQELIVLDENQQAASGEVKWTRVELGFDAVQDWQTVLIENNIGYGLWAPFKYDEREEENKKAKAHSRAPDPANWGRDLRVIMRNFTRAGYDYTRALTSEMGRPTPSGPEIEIPLPAEKEEPQPELAQPLDSDGELSESIQDLMLQHVLKKYGEDLNALRLQVIAKPELRDEIYLEAYLFLKAIDPQDTMAQYARAYLRHLFDTENLTLSYEDYLRRNAELATDRIFTASQAPLISVRLKPIALEEALRSLPGQKNHAIVFDSTLGMRDELLAFIRSARLAAEDGLLPFNVFAVTLDALFSTGEGVFANRIIFFDEKANRFLDVSLEIPIGVDRVQYQGTKYREQISQLPVAQLNPFIPETSAAFIADHKGLTTKKLEAAGVLVPPLSEIAKGITRGEAMKGLQTYLQFYFERNPGTVQAVFRRQPAHGTEGDGVELMTVHRMQEHTAQSKSVSAIYEAAQTDAVILRDEVGNVRFGPNLQRVTFRINVSSGENGTHADSGFVQVGAVGSDVSSIAKGGRIQYFDEVAKNLFVIKSDIQTPPEVKRYELTEDGLKIMIQTAEAALAALNQDVPESQQLLFAGIDLELEVTPEGLTAYVLDINPAPEGFGFSRVLNILERGDLIVSQNLFRAPIARSETRAFDSAVAFLSAADQAQLQDYAQRTAVKTGSVLRFAVDGMQGLLPLTLNTLAKSSRFLSAILHTAGLTLPAEPENDFSEARAYFGASEDQYGNIFVLGPDFSFNMGLLPAIREVYPHASLVVIAETAEQQTFVQTTYANDKNMVMVQDADGAGEAIKKYAERGFAAALKPMAFLGIGDRSDLLEALRLKQAITDIQTMTAATAVEFLSRTNSAIESLVEQVRGQFMVGRSA